MGIAAGRLVLPLVALLATEAASQDVRGERARLDREARGAYDRKDYAGFLQTSRRLAEAFPQSPRALYNLACGEALTGRGEDAVSTLERIVRMGVILDPSKDPDFSSLKGTPAFEAVVARMAALDAPLERSRVAFTLPEKDLITEGIAYDPKSGDFFVSSVHRRKVVRVSKDGVVTDFVKEGAGGLLSALALAVDARRGSLYVSSEALPMAKGLRPEEKGRSFVVEYDLATARPRRRLVAPAGLGDAHLGDLALGPDGTLAVSDPQSGRVYVLGPRDEALRVLVAAGPIVSPQGLAFSPDGAALFVADYALGIARVDPATGAVSRLPGPDDASLAGIDGLLYAGSDLIGIQNGYRPHKVMRLKLAPAGDRVMAASVLERGSPLFDEPTLGVLVDGELYFVATSQYSKVRDDGSLDLEHLRPPVVLRMRLD